MRRIETTYCLTNMPSLFRCSQAFFETVLETTDVLD